jgi:hypothetical protein
MPVTKYWSQNLTPFLFANTINRSFYKTHFPESNSYRLQNSGSRLPFKTHRCKSKSSRLENRTRRSQNSSRRFQDK